jgi:hypothetical protein
LRGPGAQAARAQSESRVDGRPLLLELHRSQLYARARPRQHKWPPRRSTGCTAIRAPMRRTSFRVSVLHKPSRNSRGGRAQAPEMRGRRARQADRPLARQADRPLPTPELRLDSKEAGDRRTSPRRRFVRQPRVRAEAIARDSSRQPCSLDYPCVVARDESGHALDLAATHGFRQDGRCCPSREGGASVRRSFAPPSRLYEEGLGVK